MKIETQNLPAGRQARQFLNPEELLKSVPIEPGITVADLGCGNGYYSIAAGVLTGRQGQVYAIDVMEDALSQTASLAKLVGIQNVTTKQCDLEKFGSCEIPATSCDLAIMAGIMHQVENKDSVIKEAYWLLKTKGRLLVVEWERESPLGPEKSRRVGKQDLKALLEKYSFRPMTELPAGSFHYALLYSK